MKHKMSWLAAVGLAVFTLVLVSRAVAAPGYTPTIPPGHSGQVVLHVDYGTTSDKVGVEWGGSRANDSDEGEYAEPASITNMRVVADRFYFIDATTDTIKQFRSPGTLVWATKAFDNLGYYAVAPDGRVYLIWGSRLDKLSCVDSQGTLLWTKDDALPRTKLKELGLDSVLVLMGIEWTASGLSITVSGSAEGEDKLHQFVVLMDRDGNALKALPGQFVGADGLIYTREPKRRLQEAVASPVTVADSAGRAVREVRPKFDADSGTRLAGVSSIGRLFADPFGGFSVDSLARLSSPARITSKIETNAEEVLWRFDIHGNFREQWRFASNKFSSRASPVVVGSDGSVYHLQFGETGIDVTKYSKQAK